MWLNVTVMSPPNNQNQSETLASPARHEDVMPLFISLIGWERPATC